MFDQHDLGGSAVGGLDMEDAVAQVGLRKVVPVLAEYVGNDLVVVNLGGSLHHDSGWTDRRRVYVGVEHVLVHRSIRQQHGDGPRILNELFSLYGTAAVHHEEGVFPHTSDAVEVSSYFGKRASSPGHTVE